MESSEALKKKWVKVYPSYIDKGLKYSEGRKISSTLAVENPSAREIFIVCSEILRLDCVEEYKHHPKDWLKRGRVLVDVKQSKNVKNKNELLKVIGQTLPQIRMKVTSTTTEDGEGKKRRRKKK